MLISSRLDRTEGSTKTRGTWTSKATSTQITSSSSSSRQVSTLNLMSIMPKTVRMSLNSRLGLKTWNALTWTLMLKREFSVRFSCLDAEIAFRSFPPEACLGLPQQVSKGRGRLRKAPLALSYSWITLAWSTLRPTFLGSLRALNFFSQCISWRRCFIVLHSPCTSQIQVSVLFRRKGNHYEYRCRRRKDQYGSPGFRASCGTRGQSWSKCFV